MHSREVDSAQGETRWHNFMEPHMHAQAELHVVHGRHACVLCKRKRYSARLRDASDSQVGGPKRSPNGRGTSQPLSVQRLGLWNSEIRSGFSMVQRCFLFFVSLRL